MARLDVSGIPPSQAASAQAHIIEKMLVQQGLAGNPLASIAEELRTVIDDVGLQQPLRPGDFARKLRVFLAEKQWLVNHSITLPAREGRFYDPAALELSPPSRRYIRSRFSQGLYGHQVAAFRRLADGNNICLETGTSSGKSIVFYSATIKHILRIHDS